MAAQAGRALSDARGTRRDREARLRQADGDAAPAPRRTEGAPSGRLEMDRHGRNLAVRRLWRPPRGRAHRSGQAPPRQRGQGLGQARVQGFRRRRGARAAQHPLALRRLRRFAREGAAEELDLDGTIRSTADKGYIDVKLRPERRNAVKVLLFLDVGGSMDWHVEAARALFSGARGCNSSGSSISTSTIASTRACGRTTAAASRSASPTRDLLNSYGRDHRVVFVGDASMSPHEISAPGGSVEHLNPEPGRGLAEARRRALAAQRLDQSDAARALGLFALDPHHIAAVQRAHVRADARRRRGGDAGAGALAGGPLSRSRGRGSG